MQLQCVITPWLNNLHLVLVGVRGFCRSGAVYERLARPGYYQYLLAKHRGQLSLSTDEIEKDLHRSLPEHPAYQTEKGISCMRRVCRHLLGCGAGRTGLVLALTFDGMFLWRKRAHRC